jgi:hypothetical protein
MTYAELRTHIRKMCNDHPKSNWSGMENVLIHEGNVINGSNRRFFLLNRRVITTSIHTYLANDEVVGSVYDEPTNAVLFLAAPPLGSMPTVSYYWHFTTDEEIDAIILEALENTNLADVSGVDVRNRRVVVSFAKAFHALFVAQHAAEYYTISAAGKTVSKESVFQHYKNLYDTLHETSMRLRDDFYQGQGTQFQASQDVGGYVDIDEDWA